ncbi:hypothetical protein LCGC14_0390860 [marine sediment metagenome]|uniref:AP2/ERF domain-containing protein n=1 Tax=marine sediment metagenome TaxID=412755 RepID=A0A0F9VLV4_9ZZZZ
MTAKYWTKDGVVMCRLSTKTVFVFENLDTGEKVFLDNMADVIETGFKPVVMPTIKAKGKKKTIYQKRAGQLKEPKVKKPKVKTVKSVGKSGSEYKGVKREGKKFSGSYWDGKNKKAVYLGMFESELLAAAAVQKKLGNYGDARRLENEHQEGDPAKQPMEE